MDQQGFTGRNTVQFGRRRAVPRVCVVDAKPHIRRFLSDTLQELGFITRECGRLTELSEALADFQPDVLVLGLLKPESEVTKALQVLITARFAGRVMLFGGRASTALMGLQELGEQVGLAMLPPLGTPFRDSDLHENLSPFLPIPDTPSFDVDVEEALRNNWLELWYQPKIDLREMLLSGAEALIRMRHPTWGIVPPASFIPDADDPNLRALSEFVVERAMADWSFFSTGRTPIDMTIHLPAALLGDSAFVERMSPSASRSRGIRQTVRGDRQRRGPPRSCAGAESRKASPELQCRHLDRRCHGGILLGRRRRFSDRRVAGRRELHRRLSRTIGPSARPARWRSRSAKGWAPGPWRRASSGRRTAALVCQLGFEIGQGFLFAKPMEAARFARSMLRHLAAKPR